ncbi:MAG TPA: hypothetical protein VHX36_14480 [Candidatus Acidoferrales bacterium]|jgi:hypothetical protein|nr:hypothetical protein [Candidatus Acidoferrales bacterium]
MKMTLVIAVGSLCLLLCMALAPRVLWAAPQQDTTAKQDIHSAGHDAKNAAKKTGSATKKGTKKAVNKSARATKHAANKVENKTQPSH